MYRLRMTLLAVFAILAWSSTGHANKSGMEPNVLSLPSGPGSLGGVGENVKPNLNMGLMSYQIKIRVPKGRGDATPNPSVSYSSSGGSSIVGIGWNFSAGSSIERATVRGLPTYTNADLFYAGGELVKIPGGKFYRARYEGGFMRYHWVQSGSNDQRGYWIAESPDGSKMYYGANSKGELQLDAQAYGTKGTFRWQLVTSVDRNGNRVEYTYFKEGTMPYPDQIAWVFDDNDKPLYHLKFGYEDRPDHISDGKPGFDLQTTKRLKEVYITSNGQRFRSYHFEFEESTGLSRLIKATQYGRDPQKAHPVEFTMKYSDATFSQQNSKMVTMPTSLGVDFRTNNIDFLDINGDGLPDVVDTSKAKHVFFMNELKLDKDMKQASHDFPQNLMVQNPTETSAQLSSASVQMLDYNGDGFTDLVDAVNKKIYINKGNTKWENSSMSLQNFPVTGKDPNMRFMDYDGNKTIDVISSDGNSTTFWLNDGQGNWTVKSGAVNIGLGFQKDRLRLIDINGDGLQDVVHITKNSLRYRKYLGYGNWTAWINVKVNGLDKYELNINAQFNDMNGDGMADMVGFFGNKIVYFVNKNGTEFADGVELQAFKGIDIPDATKTTVRITDINGNGSRDIVWIDSSGKVVYLELFGKRPNLMTAISNGIGQRINVGYGSSVYFYLRDKTCDTSADKACAGPWQNKMPMAFTVVTDITTWASRSDKPLDQTAPTTEEHPSTQKIFYHNGFYDGVERKFRGFRKVESLMVGDSSVEDQLSTIEFDVGDTDPYYHGKTKTKTISNNKGHIYSKLSYVWKDCPLTGVPGNLDPPVRYICQAGHTRTIMEGESDQAKWKTTQIEVGYDGFGNATLIKNLGEKDKQGDERISKAEYIVPQDPNADNSKWFLRLRKTTQSCNTETGPCAQKRYYYDGKSYEGLPLGEFTKGNITRTSVKVTDDKWIDKTRQGFDKYGNTIAIKNPLGLVRKVEWDSQYNRFSTKETIAVGTRSYSSETLWDYSLSVVTQSTDYNGIVQKYAYDVFGRLTAVFRPNDKSGEPLMTVAYEMKAPLNRIITKQRTKQGGPLEKVSVQCFDGLGRKLAIANLLKTGTYLINNHQEYNARNKKARVWYGYQSDKDCQFTAPTGKAQEFFYDGMGRMVRQVNEDGSFTRKLHQPFRLELYDETDNDKDSPHYNTPEIQISDGLGRAIEVIKTPSKGKTITTKFAYTNNVNRGTDLIREVTLPDGTKKTHTYDFLGRVVKVADPDRSITEYTYDDNDNVLERKEGDGTIIQLTYDSLNRVLTRQKAGKPETKRTYTYDVAPKGIPDATFLVGQLTRVAFPSGSYEYSYDERGNMERAHITINGTVYKFTRKFDNLSRLIEQTYPDGRKLTYERDLMGRLAKVSDKITKVTYNTDGTVASYTLGNGVQVAHDYDVRRRSSEIKVADGKIFSMKYSYDKVGNITSIAHTHGSQSFTNNYSYDAIHRLTNAELGDGTPEKVEYKYDDLYNTIARISSLGDKSPIHMPSMTYDKEKVHALREAGKRKMEYDKVGCMSKDGALTYTWDHMRRRLTASKDGQTLERNWYDQTARRIIKEEHGKHNIYVTTDYQIRDGKAVIYVMLGVDRIVAWSSAKAATIALPDLAPATGDKDLTPKPDSKLTAADAWLYHAGRSNIATIAVPENPLKLDYTRTLLRASLSLMLDEEKESTHYYHTDHLGSVRAVTDEKGEVIARKDYYPYGYIRSSEGNVFSYGFMGTERDAVTGANYFNTRFMDTHLGRWQSPDPEFAQIRSKDDEFNSYGAVMSNPLRYRDLDGKSSENAVEISVYVFGGISAVIGVGAGLLEIFRDRKGRGAKHALKTTATVAVMAAAAMGATVSDDTTAGKWAATAAFAVATIADTIGTYMSIQKNRQVFNDAKSHLVGDQGRKVRGHSWLSIAGNVLQAAALGTSVAEAATSDDKTSNILALSSNLIGLAAVAAKSVKPIMRKMGKKHFAITVFSVKIDLWSPTPVSQQVKQTDRKLLMSGASEPSMSGSSSSLSRLFRKRSTSKSRSGSVSVSKKPN